MTVFVFGSNLAGRHGKGAAAYARKYHGAIYGQGWGKQGNSYAIPTKDESIKTMALSEIAVFVAMFIGYAATHDDETFELTPIGCGLAGYKPEQIAPMFAAAPSNVLLPESFRKALGR